MLQKLNKFVKDNLAAVVGISAIVIVCLLLLLPGQFAVLKPYSKNPYDTLNGYQYFFNYKVVNGSDYYPAGENKGIVGIGLASLIMFVVATACYALYKKSSALLLLGGVLSVVASVFFFAMEATANKFYGRAWEDLGVIQWVSYVSGALLVLSGGFAIYKSIMIMKDELKHPQEKKAAYYSYLKK